MFHWSSATLLAKPGKSWWKPIINKLAVHWPACQQTIKYRVENIDEYLRCLRCHLPISYVFPYGCSLILVRVPMDSVTLDLFWYRYNTCVVAWGSEGKRGIWPSERLHLRYFAITFATTARHPQPNFCRSVCLRAPFQSQRLDSLFSALKNPSKPSSVSS